MASNPTPTPSLPTMNLLSQLSESVKIAECLLLRLAATTIFRDSHMTEEFESLSERFLKLSADLLKTKCESLDHDITIRVDKAKAAISSDTLKFETFLIRLVSVFEPRDGKYGRKYHRNPAQAADREKRKFRRCNQICNMRPSSVLLWVTALTLTDWHVSRQSDASFDKLLKFMESVQVPKIGERTRFGLLDIGTGVLKHCEKYQVFLETLLLSDQDDTWHFRHLSACHGTSSLSNIPKPCEKSVNNAPSVDMTDASDDETCPEGSVVSDTTTLPKLLTLDELENDSKDAATLLKLFCFLDGSNIPCGMLLRAGQPRQQWSSQGEIEDVHPSNVGFNSDLLSVISEKQKIVNATQRLETLGFIHTVTTNSFGSPIIKMNPRAPSDIERSIEDRDEWQNQALLLVHFTFPVDQYVHLLLSFGDIGRSQLLQVQYVVNHLHPTRSDRLSALGIDCFLETLLAASWFSDRSWKVHVLQLVRKTLEENNIGLDSHLWAWLEFRTAMVQRLNNTNDTHLAQICEHHQKNERRNAYVGGLIIARASNFLFQRDLSKAMSLLETFFALNESHPSKLEKSFLARKAFVQSKIWRFQGHFQWAYESLKEQLANMIENGISGVSSGISAGIYSQHAAVLCELGKANEVQLLAEKIDILKELGLQKLRRTRSLQLSLAEVLIEQHLYDKAAKIYHELECTDENEWDAMASFNRLRMYIGRAKVSHLKGAWTEAHVNWNSVMAMAEKTNWSEGFLQMVVCYSLAHVSSRLGHIEQAYFYREKAERLFPVVRRQHWFTCLGTSWLSMIQQALQEDEKLRIVRQRDLPASQRLASLRIMCKEHNKDKQLLKAYSIISVHIFSRSRNLLRKENAPENGN
ncbi:hypothetical protein L228DRAFT_258920 [Xylona heveae TC161]|uniref:Uncharacterized protein n=1 Tax=Xylona heveae (strain CBS 132557 / TC161) TaxID=1328760 RepID=A0A165IXD9_XYLHT|nr:hypothetical protein L228DRAFT_258920 [Xylona heveae TC161]KZF25504.1 hypothetical protein L228DRAFT_258920 [Xylona heveae TC161]